MASQSARLDKPLAIEVELQKEKASTLRRVGDKLERTIGELTQLHRELSTLKGSSRVERLTKYQQLRSDAEYQRWCLIVQREAMGLWNHSEVDLMYRIPPPVK